MPLPINQTVLMHSLRAASIFRGLPGEHLRRIADYAAVKSIRKGGHLFRENDPAVVIVSKE